MQKKQSIRGFVEAAGSFLIWGVLALYWNLFHYINPISLLALRILFSFLTVLIIYLVRKSLGQVLQKLFSRENRRAVFLASFLIGCNWFAFIYSIAIGQLQQSSLGYYINPLVSVFLGMIILKEKLPWYGKIALVFALIGVGYLTLMTGVVPWISFAVALSFGFYGLVKKKVNLSSLDALLGELILLSPLSLITLIITYLMPTVHPGLADQPLTTSLLLLSGGVTIIPLILFANGAKKIDLSSIGFLQFIAPTGMLIISVFIFRDPFSKASIPGYILVWSALAIFSAGQYLRSRRISHAAGNPKNPRNNS